MGFMTGKKALVVGVASNRSIAWGGQWQNKGVRLHLPIRMKN